MSKPKPSFKQLIQDPALLLAFGFGSGLSPVMPGTVGTLAAIPFFLLLQSLPLPVYLGIIALSFIVGIYVCSHASKVLGVHDHGGIVWDEFVGLWIAMIAAPKGLIWLGLGFLLFRIFDMVKPWPISLADKQIHGGFGIMIDDVLAGIAALVCLRGIDLWLL